MEIMERLDMKRIKRHNEILRENHITLLEEIEPKPAINYLYQVKTLNANDKEEILSGRTREDTNEALLYKLKLKGPNAFLEFVAGLEIGQPHLAFFLVKEEMKKLHLLESKLHTELLKLKTENEQLKTECRREPLQLRRDRNLERSSHDESGGTAASSVNEGDNLREPLQAESRLMAQCQGSRPSTRQRNKDSETEEGFILRYEGDFDTKGVIHYLGIKAGVNMWRNPARVPSSGVKVTYCDGNGSGDPENILEYFEPVNSYTRSGWCLDLGEKYTLLLSDYTIRQLGSNPKMFLQYFEILGKLYNDDEWRLLSSPDRVDWSLLHWSHSKSKGDKAEAHKAYKTRTWSVKGEVKPYRQFKIVQKKDSKPGATRMSLAGIELYGVLSLQCSRF